MTVYREVGLLAEGGMAIIAQAETGDGTTVVVKRVRPPFCFDPSFLRLFADEGSVHAALDHENIVRLLDKGEDAAGPYLVFEHVDGTDLGIVLEGAWAEGRGLDVECVLAVAVPMMKALAFVHECDLHVVHRDVSPGNVLIASDGGVKLADFGVASFSLKTEMTVAGEMKGKFAYMAPEQTRGEKVGPKADLFAAGVVVWESLAGKRLFEGPTDADVVAAVRNTAAPELPSHVPQRLRELVAALLEKDPDKRPASARDVAKALTDVALDLGFDEGLARHAARLARAAPKRELTMRAADGGAGRRTQRVLGADTAVTGGVVVRAHRGRSMWVPAAGAVVVVVAAAVAFAMQPRIDAMQETVTSLPSTPLPAMTIETKAEPELELGAPDPGPSTATATPTGAATTKKTVAEVKKAATATAATTKAVEEPRPVGFGTLSITTDPWAQVTVDGKLVAKETPFRGFTVTAGKHTVVLENPIYHLQKTVVVDVAADHDTLKYFDLNQP